MIEVDKKHRVEFGDFQTPDALALEVCHCLARIGIAPETVVEPTCGRGAFVVAAAQSFSSLREIRAFEVNAAHLSALRARLASEPPPYPVHLRQADFFDLDWQESLGDQRGPLLVLGNFPWVTNAALGAIGGANLPDKSNFLGFNGFDAISGKANFDISEWMLLQTLRWFSKRPGDIAMLVKTAVARKVLAHAERQREPVREAFIFGIDAKKSFDAAVDACLLVIRLDANASAHYDYTVFDNLQGANGRRVGHRGGLTVGNLDAFEAASHLLGQSPRKWRSGIKHDASAVMEFSRAADGYINGLGEMCRLEEDYLFPLLKGSDVGSNKAWREKFVLVTQRFVGESTDEIRQRAPKTWAYLARHAEQLDARASVIYAKTPRFAIFGIGDYAFAPWRIAVCGLYKALRFRLVGPHDGRPVMFDDTVYYLSFNDEATAVETLDKLQSDGAQALLSSLIFWDEKRPIKTSILNVLDWSKLDAHAPTQAALL